MTTLFFDIGYTLIDETAVWETRCREQAQTARAKELGLTPADIYNAICDASRAHLPQYRTVAERFGFSAENGGVAPYRHELERLYPGVPELLADLSRDFRLGVIANQETGLEERLENFGIRQYFDIVVSSADCGMMKPDTGIFRYAREKAGCDAADAYMIGDRIDNDITPAKAVGMHTVWVRQGFGALQTPGCPEEEPDDIVDSVDELRLLFCPAAQTPPPEDAAPQDAGVAEDAWYYDGDMEAEKRFETEDAARGSAVAVTGEMLVRCAVRAMKNAYAPYSHHTVGAALLTADGRVYTGCNVENAAFSPSCCAERVALYKAVSEGVKEFSAIAIVGGKHGNITSMCAPCGVCRQTLREFCDPETFLVLLGCDDGSGFRYEEYTLAELLPKSFGPGAF
ncbi:MAG: cytidine deaminase [Clostridia bacterium]|nr:cytidine deaminase [Clostridia bacterium]